MEEEIMEIHDLKVKLPKYNDQVEMFIQADVNDGDYITETSFLTLKIFKEIMPVLKKLKKHGSIIEVNDKPTVTEKEIETVGCYFPSMDNEEIHTIESIECWLLSSSDGIRYEIEL